MARYGGRCFLYRGLLQKPEGRRNAARRQSPLSTRPPVARGAAPSSPEAVPPTGSRLAPIVMVRREPTIRENGHVGLHHPPSHVVRLAHQPSALVAEVAQQVGGGPLVTSWRSRGPAGDAGAVGARWCRGPLRVTQRLDDPGSPKEGHLTDHRRGILTVKLPRSLDGASIAPALLGGHAWSHALDPGKVDAVVNARRRRVWQGHRLRRDHSGC